MSAQECPTHAAAKDILEMIRSVYIPSHDYQSVDLKDYPHIDSRFYSNTKTLLESEGFIHLGDQEDMSLANAKGNFFKRVPARCMISNDGVIMAACYHAKLSPIWLRVLLFILRKKVGKTIDFESEFQDGSFVCTSNAALAGAIKNPPIIHSEFHAVDTPCVGLLQRHRERVVKHIQNFCVSPRRIQTISEQRESQNRMNAIKAAFRGELGSISLEELEKVSFSKAQAADVHKEVQKIRNLE